MEFISVLFPVFAIFGIGYIGEKKVGFDTKPLSAMALYLLSPILVFRTFSQSHFDKTYLYMVLYTFLLCFILIIAVYAVGYIMGYSQKEICGLILASAFMNNGNYGTPLVLFVFGAIGLHYAVVLMVIQQLVMCTVGVYYAAKGGTGSQGVKAAIRAVRNMPIIYGAIAGGLFQLLEVPIPKPWSQAIDLLADATVPIIMIILGMQLAKISIKTLALDKLVFSLGIKMVLSPIVAYVIILFLPVESMLKQIMILMAAMPTAANTTMYALQYNTEPHFVTSATFISTGVSLVTLPIVLFLIA